MLEESVNGVLSTIAELGFVRIANGYVVQSVKPEFNIYTSLPELYQDRWDIAIQYLGDYAHHHPLFNGEYFLCLYDGWREAVEGVVESERVYTEWRSYSPEQQTTLFSGVGSIGEPRFYSQLDPTVYVNLPLPILAFSRHVNDSNVLLMPDHEFLEKQFHKQVREVIGRDIPWTEKQSQIIWRGSDHSNEGYTYCTVGYEDSFAAAGRDKIHPRELAVVISNSKGSLSPDIGAFLNASYESTTIEEMLKYKYQLDLDGMVNAWSGLYWKLFSNSVVFKLRSHVEQWYYRDLIPYVHFIPLENLSPRVVNDAFEWCEVTHAQECQQIAIESTKFARKLNYEYAVKEYIIR